MITFCIGLAIFKQATRNWPNRDGCTDHYLWWPRPVSLLQWLKIFNIYIYIKINPDWWLLSNYVHWNPLKSPIPSHICLLNPYVCWSDSNYLIISNNYILNLPPSWTDNSSVSHPRLNFPTSAGLKMSRSLTLQRWIEIVSSRKLNVTGWWF